LTKPAKMLPGCWLVSALLLAPGSWGARGQCPSCEDGDPPACAPRAGCRAPERAAAAPPDSAKAPREACGEKGCARALGEPCGVYSPSCARGLRCIPRAGERTPLHALLHGKGVCRARAPSLATSRPPGNAAKQGGAKQRFQPAVAKICQQRLVSEGQRQVDGGRHHCMGDWD
uniref:Insulin like growth factor binding protein 6 n=1 Tax=Terrapene triunguis TaxID=2587831 RepID=A0A674IVL3_9SAUR